MPALPSHQCCHRRQLSCARKLAGKQGLHALLAMACICAIFNDIIRLYAGCGYAGGRAGALTPLFSVPA